jgi:hypothetical protein
MMEGNTSKAEKRKLPPPSLLVVVLTLWELRRSVKKMWYIEKEEYNIYHIWNTIQITYGIQPPSSFSDLFGPWLWYSMKAYESEFIRSCNPMLGNFTIRKT